MTELIKRKQFYGESIKQQNSVQTLHNVILNMGVSATKEREKPFARLNALNDGFTYDW